MQNNSILNTTRMKNENPNFFIYLTLPNQKTQTDLT